MIGLVNFSSFDDLTSFYRAIDLNKLVHGGKKEQTVSVSAVYHPLTQHIVNGTLSKKVLRKGLDHHASHYGSDFDPYYITTGQNQPGWETRSIEIQKRNNKQYMPVYTEGKFSLFDSLAGKNTKTFLYPNNMYWHVMVPKGQKTVGNPIARFYLHPKEEFRNEVNEVLDDIIGNANNMKLGASAKYVIGDKRHDNTVLYVMDKKGKGMKPSKHSAGISYILNKLSELPNEWFENGNLHFTHPIGNGRSAIGLSRFDGGNNSWSEEMSQWGARYARSDDRGKQAIVEKLLKYYS